ncbi:hypothetical protein ABPG74_005945 [Tetrahymena malaccensis]
MKIEIFLISLLLTQGVFADAGKPVTCAQGQTDCKSCPQMYYFNWIYDPTTQQCYIEDCNASNIINFTDQYCLSCQSHDANTYSNYSSCVKSTDSCLNQRTKPWTDSDCKICGIGQYAIFNGQECSYNDWCTQQQIWTDSQCQNCNWQYVASLDQTNCVNTKGVSCSPQQSFPLAGKQITDQYCQVCHSPNSYADIYLGKCVQSSDTCGVYQNPSGNTYWNPNYLNNQKRKTPWTDDDCKICSSQYAFNDKSGCFSCNQIAQQKQQYNDEICQKCFGNKYFATIDGNFCVQSTDTCGKGAVRQIFWTDNDCQLCNAGQYAYQQQSLQNISSLNGCFSCTASQGDILQFNDEKCQKCQGQGYYATIDGKKCVQSQDSCGNNNQMLRVTPWTDQDCKLCKYGIYAYANKKGCFFCQPDVLVNKFPQNIQYNDEICLKCYGKGYFATVDKSSCVQSSDSCEVISNNISVFFQSPRQSPWTDQDCQLCKAGQQALPDKLGCYSCPKSQQNIIVNDLICQLCFGQGYYANIKGQSCVKSSDTCGKNYIYNLPTITTYMIPNRQSLWTDEDCQLCQVGQYATLDKTACFSCNYLNIYGATSYEPATDYMCQICIGQGYYASAQGICVKSSDSCGVHLTVNNIDKKNGVDYIFNHSSIQPQTIRKTPWTDQDCFLCQAGYYTNYDKSYCSPIQCSNQKTWTDSLCQQCGFIIDIDKIKSINYYASIDKKSCVQNYQSCSNTINIDDSYCQTCYKNSKVFASSDRMKCLLQLQDSCDTKIRKALWTDSDCQQCKKGQYATFDKKSCTKTANCSSQKPPFTDDFCQQCGSGKQYASDDGSKCLNINHSCKHTGSWSESECQLCFNKNMHVNINGTGCVKSHDSCQNRNSQWTDQDCKLCYPQKNISINSLGTECVDIDCQKKSGWTDYECFKCNPLKPIASSDKKSCQQQK